MMVPLDPCLNQFLDPVPVAPHTLPLRAAVAVMTGASCDRLVLLDAQQQPLGLVSLIQLVSCWMALSLDQGQPRSDPRPLAPSPIAAEPLIPPDLVLPLSVVSGGQPLSEFLSSELGQPRFLADASPHTAINDQGEVLGLLSPRQILGFLSASLPEWLKLAAVSAAAPLASDRWQEGKAAFVGPGPQSSGPLPPIRQPFVWQLLSPPPPLEPSPDSPPAATTPLAEAIANQPTLPLDPLLELLKRLPLPLMLQTSNGRVLAQTDLWVQQAEQLQDPNAVRQEASFVLQELAEIDPQSSALLNDLAAEGMIPTVCQLGTTPNTFTCICPLKTGQEQILQFVRIPLGTLRLPLDAESAGRSPSSRPSKAKHRESDSQGASHSEPELPLPFQLAELLPAIADLQEQGAGPPAASEPLETLWLVLAQDVTEQQQLARELTAKNADLIQLNRLKDEFLACISHELRTPLTAVLGLSTLLKDQTLGQLNQRQVHYAQLIYQSGRHLMTVVNDILDLTRMETGQLELVSEPVDIRVVCDRAIEQAKQLRLLDDKQAPDGNAYHIPDVALDLEPGLKFLVADELRLRQMLVHLFSNAFKFTETNQQVGLNVNRWGGWIAFTVWDTGLGIPADKQHLIFQKFKQLENPLTRRFEGTGLGLAITQRLARLHGGDVTFISKEGEGSQFTILLPPTPPDKSQRPSNEVEADGEAGPGDRVPLYGQTTDCYAHTPSMSSTSILANRNRLVLVVEAVPQFVETISQQLTGLGYRVVIARSGTEALEKARRLQPCLIFLNPVLPLLSGWDVLTLLKSSPTTGKIPVVMTTTQVDAEPASGGPADGSISLPIQEKVLRQTLRQVLLESDDPPTAPTGKLTVLHLNSGLYNHNLQQNQNLVDDLNQLLHSRQYRVLEADDLEQAELLARVWKPKVVMLSGATATWDLYFQQFSQYTFLASLPLVTLDQETTQAANQIPGLLVFPCLAPLEPQLGREDLHESSALLQVIQVAAGYSWQPSLLALDLATLPGQASGPLNRSPVPSEILGSLPKEAEWLQALTQYLGTAGFRALIGRSWQEVWQQLETQSADILLIGWTATAVDELLLERLTALHRLNPRPPILVLDHRHHDGSTPAILPLPPELSTLATKVLPPSISMSELLEQIHQVMR